MSDNVPDSSNFRGSDVKKIMKELGEASSSDKIRSVLKTFWIFSSENKDASNEFLDGGIVEVLIGLFNSEKGKVFQEQIASILILLSTENEKSKNCVLDIVMIALCNIFSKSDLNVFLQSMSGIIEIATLSSESESSVGPSSSPFPSSSSSSSSALSSSPLPIPTATAAHFLSVTSSAMVFEKATALLASPSVRDRSKIDVLDTLLQLVNTGVMNEAAEFAGWRQSEAQTQTQAMAKAKAQTQTEQTAAGKEGAGEKGGESSQVGMAPTVRFVKAFEDFAKEVKTVSITKARTGLGGVAKDVCGFIQDKTFFPTFITFDSENTELVKQKVVNYPLKFLVNTAISHVTNSGNKLYWNSDGWCTYIVDPEMSNGLYKISVEWDKDKGNCGTGLGLCTNEQIASHARTFLYSGKGTFSLAFNGVLSNGTYVFSGSLFSHSCKVTLGLELDADKHMLYFFVNGEQIPHCVTGVPPSVHFAVSGHYQGFSVELKELTKVTTLSINPSLTCTQYKWS